MILYPNRLLHSDSAMGFFLYCDLSTTVALPFFLCFFCCDSFHHSNFADIFMFLYSDCFHHSNFASLSMFSSPDHEVRAGILSSPCLAVRPRFFSGYIAYTLPLYTGVDVTFEGYDLLRNLLSLTLRSLLTLINGGWYLYRQRSCNTLTISTTVAVPFYLCFILLWLFQQQ